jgi:DNA invertase Pin-like site-specific DNA recombinase
MTTYGYARISSRDQNPGRQIAALKSEGIDERYIFTDRMSGKNFNREEYDRLKRLLREGDMVVVKSIDRFGRNYRDIIEEWRSLTQDVRADIRVLDLPLLDTSKLVADLTGAFVADLVLQIMSYFAEQERVYIRHRQAEGIAVAKARGVKLGKARIKKPRLFDETHDRWKRREITLDGALKSLGLKRTTFFKFARERTIEPRSGKSPFENP